MKTRSDASLPDFLEIKFDGYRALAVRGGGETRVLSRNQKDLGKKFTNIRDSIAALDVQDAIIDGEIVALDDKGRSSFQLLQGFDMGLVRPPIVFYAFDLLRLNGKDPSKATIGRAKGEAGRVTGKAARRHSLLGLVYKKDRRTFIPGSGTRTRRLDRKAQRFSLRSRKTHRSMGQDQALPRARIRGRRIYVAIGALVLVTRGRMAYLLPLPMVV